MHLIASAQASSEGCIGDVAFADAMRPFALADGSQLAVAVSGGPDSMALLRLLCDWAAPRNVQITALTVDHRLRAASAAEAQQVATWCRVLGVPHHVLAWGGGERQSLRAGSPQTAAREARYALMTAWCRAHGVDALCLAHHADDQVETFLMRLARGSGVDGLAGMAADGDWQGFRLLRPLLDFPKAALVATCATFAQDWIADPSNENAASTRVRFRQARELLAAEGLTDARLLQTVSHMQRARTALRVQVQALLAGACQWDVWGVASVDTGALLAAPEEVGLRALARLLMVAGGAAYGPRFERLHRLYASLRQGPWRDATLHGCLIARDGARTVFTREVSAVADVCVVAPGESRLWDRRFRLTLAPNAPTPVRVQAAGDQASAVRLPEAPRAACAALPMLQDDCGPLCLPVGMVMLRDGPTEAWKDKVLCRFVHL